MPLVDAEAVLAALCRAEASWGEGIALHRAQDRRDHRGEEPPGRKAPAGENEPRRSPDYVCPSGAQVVSRRDGGIHGFFAGADGAVVSSFVFHSAAFVS